MIVLLILSIYGCDRGVGQEPISVEEVCDNNLTGTWVLSKEYTNQKIIERLNKNIDEYYFKLFSNNTLEYHSFDKAIGFSKPKFLNENGKWKLENKKYLKLDVFFESKTYVDEKGIYHYNTITGNPPKGKFVKIETSILLGRFKTFRLTKKNNKLLLWCYRGDPDARRYIMYEKKE